ncbi:MAG TPA: cytochrome ubiquinol oxidase subunit I [Candidatus Binatus sp.]|nr:cytochrome ubiquinol oxidase subunit I [Candidatus Binatus sp.]
MEFPLWYVPFITAPMLIPLIAVPHVIVAQFAVGAGILLADLVRRAHRDHSAERLVYLKGLTRFFVLITLVFGAVTGVGIWWTIGLSSPETTSALIHIFVFGWAAEWTMFALELVAAFAFYYLWDRLSPREHIIIGWIYAGAAWVSLVLITGITSFMLTTGSWTSEANFFAAFFNPSFLPQTLLRTGGSIVIAALAFVFHVSFRSDRSDLKDLVVRTVSQWATAGMVLSAVGGVWFMTAMPDHAQLNLMRAPILLIMTGLNFTVTLLVVAALAWGVVSGARWITPPSALMLLLAGALAITTGEFVREGTRKPYRIENYLIAPGVLVKQIPALQKDGFLAHSRWPRFYLQHAIGPANRELVDQPARSKTGEAIFQYHCAMCHAFYGYNGIKPILQPWTPQLIKDGVRNLHRTNPAMPPWLGTAAERDFLAVYLIQLSEEARAQ